jgi:hypothetical protein
MNSYQMIYLKNRLIILYNAMILVIKILRIWKYYYINLTSFTKVFKSRANNLSKMSNKVAIQKLTIKWETKHRNILKKCNSYWYAK